MRRIINIYKNAFTGLSRATWWLSVVMLINRSGTMVVPFLTLYMTEALHCTLSQAGLVMAIFGAGAVIGGVLGGKLADKFGFFNIQIATLLSGGMMFFVLGQIHSYTGICIAAFILAVVNESFRPANSSAIATYSNDQNRTRSYSLNRLAINLGWAAGGAFGGIIAGHNYNLLFYIDGCTNIVAAVILMVVLSPQRNPATPFKRDIPASDGPVSSPYKDKIYLFYLLMTVMFSGAFFQWFTTIPVYYRKMLHLKPEFIGMVMAMNGIIIGLVEMAYVFALEQRKRDIHYMAIGGIFMSVSFLVYNFFPGYMSLAIMSMLLCTLGEMTTMPFMNSFMISRTQPSNRGQYAGLTTAAWSVAQVLGPFFGTRIADNYGFTVLWFVMGAWCVINAVGFKWLEKMVKEEQLGVGSLSE